jgi:hypothetical protein
MFVSEHQRSDAVVSKDHILTEIRRTAAANGGQPLGKRRFASETGIREHDWLGRYWARWGDALREAGFSANQLQIRVADETIFESLALYTRELGRFPTDPELRLRRGKDDSFPSHSLIGSRGSKRELATKLAAYCQDRPDFADVLPLIEPVLAEEANTDSDDAADPEVDWGFVYLLKSGRYYKIGYSNSAGRRERELQIQMPEPATNVHVIRTDDPAGIERYWHQRFAGRRKNGEWFELTAADVSAFKRRKFM